MLNQSVILLVIISFLDLILGLFVLYKNPKNKINRSYALMALAALVWINASFFEDEFKNPDTMYTFLKLDFTAGAFLAFFLMLFSFDISKSKISDQKYFRPFFFIIPMILSLLLFLTNTILSGYEIIQKNVINPMFGPGELVYDFFVILALISGVGIVALKYKKVTSQEKLQFIYLLIGLFLFVLIVVLTNIVLTDYIESSPNYNLYTRFGSFSIIFVILFSGYAIIKHGLLNIKTIATELLSLGIMIISLFQVLNSQTASELIINGIIFIVILLFIIMLVKSVENEVKRKEELQLMSGKLALANDQLRVLDNAKSEFISIASHQLRTPLTAIKGFVSLLLEGSYGKLDAKQEDVLNKVYLSNDRLVNLVEDLLNISRIESGRMEFKFELRQIEDICQEVVDTFAIKARERGLSLEYKKPAELLPKIMIDGAKVREAISNMMDNAIKYTPRGGVTLRVERVEFPITKSQYPNKPQNLNDKNDQECIRITVSDTGIGITEIELPYLFAKFSRGKDTKRLGAGGTGLGLYVGRNMIEASGGKIWAESDGQDKGSRFIIELPIGENKAEVEKRLEKFIENI